MPSRFKYHSQFSKYWCPTNLKYILYIYIYIHLHIWTDEFGFHTFPVQMWNDIASIKLNKQRVLMHGHQVWNVRHGLCHIYMRYVYIYIWVVYSFCLFCCLFIVVTWWYVWCIEWASGNQEEVQACLVTLCLFIISCYSLYKTTI